MDAPPPRAYICPLPVERAELHAPEASYLSRVRRLTQGDEVEIFDGRGNTVTAAVEIPGKKRRGKKNIVVLNVAGRPVSHPRPEPEIHLAAAVPKGARLDWLLEKIQEMGAASFTPLKCERAVRIPDGLSENPKTRARLIEAARQSRQNHLVEVSEPVEWKNILDIASRYALSLIFDPDGRPFRELPLPSAWSAGILLAIGPEGGFTAKEKEEAEGAGFTPVSLGHGILRIETAAIAAVAAARIRFSEG
ncbi:MAG: RsmE family RNA methyltransferase [Planctomycetota bacterium]